jgi:putative transposase
MEKATPAATATPPTCLGGDWFDPLEDAVRGQVRAFIEQLLEELEAALGRGRYARGRGAKGHRNGHRDRRLDTTFGPLVLAVPRARLAAADAGEREWKSGLLPAYQRLTRRAELLIAAVYLAGVNTRRVAQRSRPCSPAASARMLSAALGTAPNRPGQLGRSAILPVTILSA